MTSREWIVQIDSGKISFHRSLHDLSIRDLRTLIQVLECNTMISAKKIHPEEVRQHGADGRAVTLSIPPHPLAINIILLVNPDR